MNPAVGVREMKKSIRGLIYGAVLGFAPAAAGADLGEGVFFQPTPVASTWAGFYAGAQGGFTHTDVTFGLGAPTMLDNMLNLGLPGRPVLSQPLVNAFRGSGDGASYGGFVGYNSQWESVILGVEANYNHASVRTGVTQILPLSPPNIGTATSIASARLTDYGTLRGRAGWICGPFLPYAMLGLALGNINFADSATLQYTPVVNGVPLAPVNLSNAFSQSVFALGYAAGVGFDWMVTGSVFLRAEYEFVQFTSVGTTPVGLTGGGPIDHKLTLNSLHAGLGVKF